MPRERLLLPWCWVFGGDFFQVIPHADGSLLIVVGDVSGKGIAAAMLVAVLVGTIRTRADGRSCRHSRDTQ
ncbi:MAG: hypothetical protein QOK38_2429 [Acidobacteriaceae bacterium]|jgi:serine phosphatase RsbU (regulator of sigma subunit)|nr:hypothetical protein [Acidobacteriaceae bacterium]